MLSRTTAAIASETAALSVGGPGLTPRRLWALRTLGTWIGCEFRTLHGDGYSEAPDIYFGRDPEAARRATIWIPPTDEPKAAVREALSIVAANESVFESPQLPCRIDLACVVAELLTAAEGASNESRDEHGRLPDELTWIGAAGLEHLPVCHIMAEQFAVVIRARTGRRLPEPGISRWPEKKRFAAVLTHDVDMPERYDAEGRRRLASQLWHHGAYNASLRQSAMAALSTARRALGLKDSSWAFREWMAFEESLGFRSTWAFLPICVDEPGGNVNDARYRVTDARYRSMLSEMSTRGFEVALHAAYESFRSGNAIETQTLRLQHAAGAELHGVRHHFWRLDPAAPCDAWRMHAKAGLKYDLSLSFSRRIGFRSGAALPYRPFDPVTERPMDLLVIPSTLMDASLCRGRTHHEAVTLGIQHLETCRKHGLCAVFDWHARTWDDQHDCRGFGDVARSLYRWLAAQDDVWVTSAGGAEQWWRSQLAARNSTDR